MSRTASRPALGSAIAVALGLYAAHVVLYLRYVNDDAFITYRYSRFLAEGLGPYFNVGEHVEGYTNFLQMLILAGIYLLGGEAAVPVFSKALGITTGAAAIVIAVRTTRSLAALHPALSRHVVTAAFLTGALVAVFPGFALNGTSGLETSLYAMLIALGVRLALQAAERGRWCGAGLAWAAAALTRPEGVVVFGVFAVATVVARWLPQPAADADPPPRIRRDLVPSHLWLDLAVVGFAVASHVAFRIIAYDGELLPNTYYAKALGYWGKTPWEYVRAGGLAPFLGPVGVAAGVVGLATGGTRIRRALPVVAVALLGAGLPFLVGADWMPGWRFSAPYLPLLATVVALGWVRILDPLTRRHRAIAPAVAALLVGAAAFLHHGERRDLAQMVELRADGYASGHRRLAAWIRDSTAPGDTVALMDIGIVGYYCPEQRILDITGLTDRHIARSPGTFLKKSYDVGYLLDRDPALIVVVFSAYEWVPHEVDGQAGDMRVLLDPSEPIPDDATLGTWIRTEAEILTHSDFDARYRRVREDPGPDASDGDRLAARVGAERVFVHSYPGQFYWLAAFRRHDRPAGSEWSERLSGSEVGK